MGRCPRLSQNRGRGKQLLGRFEEAFVDFGLAEKIDFDETTHTWMKEVEANVRCLLFALLFPLRRFVNFTTRVRTVKIIGFGL